MIRHRLAARGDFKLGIIRPVLKASSEPRASGLVVVPHDGVFHGGRSQVRVVGVVHRAIRDELALYPCGPGRRQKERVLLRENRLIKSRLS